MVVSREVAANRLKRTEHALARLRRLATMPLDAYLADEDARTLAERHLQIAAQCLLDLGNHIVAEEGLGSPDDADGILDCLAGAGVVAPALHARVKGLGGFRNILVHDYLGIDHRRVHAMLGRLDDLADLARALGEHADKPGG
ncbi:MAG: DUF86 domain-containing protein [Myxococcota bacterium]